MTTPTMADLEKMRAQINDAITKLKGGEKPTKEKRPSARRSPVGPDPILTKRGESLVGTVQAAREKDKEKAPKKRGPNLAAFAPVDDHESTQGDAECVCSYHQPDADEVPDQAIKLSGKDELLISWCPEHECAHYFLGQPKAGGGYVVHELVRGMQICKVKATPSGDMDTETALERIEERLGDFEEDEDEDEEDED